MEPFSDHVAIANIEMFLGRSPSMTSIGTVNIPIQPNTRDLTHVCFEGNSKRADLYLLLVESVRLLLERYFLPTVSGIIPTHHTHVKRNSKDGGTNRSRWQTRRHVESPCSFSKYRYSIEFVIALFVFSHVRWKDLTMRTRRTVTMLGKEEDTWVVEKDISWCCRWSS